MRIYIIHINLLLIARSSSLELDKINFSSFNIHVIFFKTTGTYFRISVYSFKFGIQSIINLRNVYSSKKIRTLLELLLELHY